MVCRVVVAPDLPLSSGIRDLCVATCRCWLWEFGFALELMFCLAWNLSCDFVAVKLRCVLDEVVGHAGQVSFDLDVDCCVGLVGLLCGIS